MRFEEAMSFRADYLLRFGADRLLRAAAEMGREAQARREDVLQRNMRRAFDLAQRFTNSQITIRITVLRITLLRNTLSTCFFCLQSYCFEEIFVILRFATRWLAVVRRRRAVRLELLGATPSRHETLSGRMDSDRDFAKEFEFQPPHPPPAIAFRPPPVAVAQRPRSRIVRSATPLMTPSQA